MRREVSLFSFIFSRFLNSPPLFFFAMVYDTTANGAIWNANMGFL